MSSFEIVDWLNIHDKVLLTRDFKIYGLKAGELGEIVDIRKGLPAPYSVEFAGRHFAFKLEDLRLIKPKVEERVSPINQLRDEIHQAADDNGWWSDADKEGITETVGSERNFGEVIALCHSELSEALEEWRHGHDYNEIYYDENSDTPNKPEGVPTELADTIIRILDFCGRYRIDIDSAIDLKLKYNATRGYRHGNKRA